MSLKEMFAVLTAAAVFCWCAAQAGFDNGYFWVATLTSLVMSAIWLGLATRTHGRWLAMFAPAPLVLFCVATIWSGFSGALLIHALLLFVAGAVCALVAPRRVKTLIAILVGCTLASFVGAAAMGRAAVEELEAMKRAYPAVSLAKRLEYERGGDSVREGSTPPKLASKVDQDLAELEKEQGWFRNRQWMLTRIHRREYENFVRAVGFGIDRMPRPNLKSLARPPLRDIAFDETKAGPRSREYYGNWGEYAADGRSDDVESLYAASRDDFLDPDGIGAIIVPLTEVAGFISHAFHDPPATQLKNSDAWTIERLELVSLLKFDEPRVYVLDHLPRMDQLSGDGVRTRALDEFETESLAKLWADEDVIVEEQAGAVRMLGSLRAGRQCLECHSARRGELLGAFSYVLRPGNGAAETEQ